MSTRQMLKLSHVLIVFFVGTCFGTSIIVAPSDASKADKARATLVCDGKDDQKELLVSITKAKKYSVMVDRPVHPKLQSEVTCYGRHAVEWLPGNYNLSSTLTIPDAADLRISAEGAYFNYQPTTGDAVVIQGMNRCRYYFGTIQTQSEGAAIRVKPTQAMPSLMSVVSFTGLIGGGQSGLVGQKVKGIGLYLDSSIENVCTNRFEGTDIHGFDVGVLVGGANPDKTDGTVGKTDTNWFWFSYIRLCNTCIKEENFHVDCNFYNLNVEASEPDSVALRIGGVFGRWNVILGSADWFWRAENKDNQCKSLIFDPGAKHNIVEFHPPLTEGFAPIVNNSGNNTNVILQTSMPPLSEAAGIQWDGNRP